MTQVTFSPYHEKNVFECTGHTGYSALGQDILCSAVSCLCYTLDAYLQKAHEEGKIKDYSSVFREGFVNLSFEYADRYDFSEVREAVKALLFGFVLLEESYPDYIDTDL